MVNLEVWRDMPVFVTGHTGFKGSWLTLCLSLLGAQVSGYALDPPTQPNLFEVAQVEHLLKSDQRGDLRDFLSLANSLEVAQPRVIFHLAAQPLVRASYTDPLGTFETNVMGTAYLLEAIRRIASVRAVVIVTTDKVYENREWIYPYREIDPLGGHDPYSASKAATEIVVNSYRRSFFALGHGDSAAQIATARAGNVLGGGDWAKDRLVPDCLKAFAQHQPVALRNPNAVRPWQHVLEPLFGYLLLAEKLLLGQPGQYSNSWNFGPDAQDYSTVGQVAQIISRLWGGDAQVTHQPAAHQPHEAQLLRLDVSRAHGELGWYPRWCVEQALTATVDWHQAWRSGKAMDSYSFSQIQAYQAHKSKNP